MALRCLTNAIGWSNLNNLSSYVFHLYYQTWKNTDNIVQHGMILFRFVVFNYHSTFSHSQIRFDHNSMPTDKGRMIKP